MACIQGGGTGGLAFVDTIYKAATLPASWTAPQRELQHITTASPRPLPNQGGLLATVSDLHHEQHTARPELYTPKVRPCLPSYSLWHTLQGDRFTSTVQCCLVAAQYCIVKGLQYNTVQPSTAQHIAANCARMSRVELALSICVIVLQKTCSQNCKVGNNK